MAVREANQTWIQYIDLESHFSIQKWSKLIIYKIPAHYKLIIFARMGHYFAHYNDQAKLIILIVCSGCTG